MPTFITILYDIVIVKCFTGCIIIIRSWNYIKYKQTNKKCCKIIINAVTDSRVQGSFHHEFHLKANLSRTTCII